MRPLLVLSLACALSGCALSPVRNCTLTDMATGQTCPGGFNGLTKQGWVVLPEGVRLTGKIMGAMNGQTTQHFGTSTSHRSTSLGLQPTVSHYSGSSYTAATEGHGYSLLKSEDGKIWMDLVVWVGPRATSGYGTAKVSDGREFRVVW